LGLSVIQTRSLQWYRTQIRDALELFVLPGLAAVLPWRLCFAVFRQLAKYPGLYREATEAGWVWAHKTMPTLEAQKWQRERRLLTLVDHADWVLSMTRSKRWLRRHVAVQGQWPTPGTSQVICTFHWGAGMWTLPAMRQAGLQVHALAATLQGQQFAARPVLHAYARWRTGQVVKALGHPTLDVTASMRPVLQALKDHECLLGVLDVPADNFGSGVAVQMFGQDALVPKGLLRLAADKQLPVTVYLTGLDFETGRRKWVIQTLGVVPHAQKLLDEVFALLNQAVKDKPSCWHLWSEMPRFIQKNQG
jgi:hypothetical protein